MRADVDWINWLSHRPSIDGQCLKVPAAPCDDGVDYTLDTCDEATKTCAHTFGDLRLASRNASSTYVIRAPTGCCPESLIARAQRGAFFLRSVSMKKQSRVFRLVLAGPLTAIGGTTGMATAAALPSAPQPGRKPNIVFIMGDDIGWFNIGAYHQGIMSGRTPNLDRVYTVVHV